jgi:hypothetical protein
VWRIVKANFPECGSDGIYSPRNIPGSRNRSLHAEGRALDIRLNALKPDEKRIADGLLNIFIECASELDAQEIIWNRQIWSQGRPFLHLYVGLKPHVDHIHLGFTREGSQRTAFPLFIVKLGIFRTGLEDIRRAEKNLA